MNSNTRRILVLALGAIAIFSSLAVLANGYSGLPGPTYTTSPYQSAFEQSMSAGSSVQMSTDGNYSAVQSQLSQYNLTLLPGTQTISFMVNFNLANQAALGAYINQENNPTSPNYHHFLTAKDFVPGSEFGPSKTAYNDVIQYYTSQGFTVKSQYGLGISFSGNVSQVNNAFNTSMISFMSGSAQKYASLRPLSVPTVFASSISSIDGLTNLLVYKPDSMLAQGSTATAQTPYKLGSNAVTSYISQSGLLNYDRHSFAWANVPGYGLTQFMFPTTMPLLYNATDLISHGYNGKGITIAVVMGQGFNPSDLATYSSEAFNNPGQLLNRLTQYPVNGAANSTNNTYLDYSNGLAGEFTLDLEYSSTMAPGANLDAVFGPDLSTLSLDTVYQTLVSTITPTPQIVTNSWGGDEDIWWNLFGPSYQNANTMNYLFEVLTSMGSNVFFSSGDSAGVGALTGFLSPSFASTSPYVIGVGGVRTVANSTQGPYPTGNVSNFTLSPYSNQVAGIGSGLWLPNYPLQVANATGIATQSYWYTPSGGSVPYAGGQVGISYWYNQSAYQHGPGIPNVGRQNSVTISGEADFNETEYFAGMWVFFWGGTSFACPTVAGEFADILSFMLAQPGISNTSSFGSLLPIIYEVGAFQHVFSGSPFYSVSNGSNPWAAANQNLGWPNDLYYPAGWTQESTGYTYLTGWGTVNAYNFAHDFLDGYNDFTSSFVNVTHNTGTPLYMTTSGLNSNINYTFTVIGRNAPHSVIPSAKVNITIYNQDGALLSYYNTTADSNGNFTFNTTGLGGDTFTVAITNSTGGISYWYAYINNVSATGTLQVTVLQNTIMGGFAGYSNAFSLNYPGYAPLMPNTAEVLVTLNGNPVENAYVYAQQADYLPLYTNANQTSTSLRSVGFTNASGIAFVETWNVADNSTYYVNASYNGLNATTTMSVTPQYTTHTPTSFLDQLLQYYYGIIALPEATPGTTYQIPLVVTNYNGSSTEVANVSIGYTASYDTYLVQNLYTPVQTGPTGEYNLSIDSSYGPGLYYINISIPNANPTMYNGMPLHTTSTYIPLYITGSEGGTFTGVSSDGSVSSVYVGRNFTMSGAVSTDLLGFGAINGGMTTGPMYWFDNGAPQAYPIGTDVNTDPQSAVVMNVPIPADLPLGQNTFNVNYTDLNLGVNVSYQLPFYIISNVNGTAPVSTIGIDNTVSPYITQSGTNYYTGMVTFALTNTESSYSSSTIDITNTAGTVNLTFDVTGMSAFYYNFTSLAAGAYTVTYAVTNVNGQVDQSYVTLNAQAAYSVVFTETGLASGTSWNVTFNGVTESSTTSTITFTDVLPGTYSYSFGSITGYSVPASSSITVSGNANVNAVFVKTLYTVTFTETGLASGTSWNVTFNGVTESSTTSTITFTDILPGTYTYTVASVSGYASPSGTSLTVAGNGSVNLVFYQLPKPTTYTVTFTETGLASGTSWNVTFNGVTHSSTTSTITFTDLSTGSYTYSYGNVTGYTTPGSHSISVSGNGSVNAVFAKIPAAVSTISTTAMIYIIGGTIGGLIVGAVVVALIRRPKV